MLNSVYFSILVQKRRVRRLVLATNSDLQFNQMTKSVPSSAIHESDVFMLCTKPYHSVPPRKVDKVADMQPLRAPLSYTHTSTF